MNKDTSHSWVRISHGLNKLVTDLIDKEYDDNEQATSEMKFEEYSLKTNVLALQADPRLKQNREDLDLTKPRQVESAPRYSALGRKTACSTNRIEVLSNKIERSHPPRYTPSLLYLEGNCAEI